MSSEGTPSFQDLKIFNEFLGYHPELLTFLETLVIIFRWHGWQEQSRRDSLTMLPGEETGASRHFS